jgi:hypothetical protein
MEEGILPSNLPDLHKLLESTRAQLAKALEEAKEVARSDEESAEEVSQR